jgi:hypothetical protein
MDDEAAKKIAERFVRFVETGDPNDVLAADVFADINVPEWRFQLLGAAAVAGWLAGEQPNGCRVASWRADATSSGAVVEIEQWYDADDTEIMSRNIHRLEVREGRVTDWTMYCTGEWSPELRERQAREAPMIRP